MQDSNDKGALMVDRERKEREERYRYTPYKKPEPKRANEKESKDEPND